MIDLALVVDASGSVRDDWNIQLNFIVDVVKKINLGPEGSHIGLVYFGDEATKSFDFTEFDKTPYNEQEILQKILDIPRPREGERTYINRGLRLANRNVLRTQFGMRPDVKQVYFRQKRKITSVQVCSSRQPWAKLLRQVLITKKPNVIIGHRHSLYLLLLLLPANQCNTALKSALHSGELKKFGRVFRLPQMVYCRVGVLTYGKNELHF